MRIALVNPVARRTQGYHTIGTYIPQLGLQVLANLVPSPHEVDIVDEVFGLDRTPDLLREGKYDLVGVTAYSSSATRAYELAALCRSLKIPCVMGGPHASACPDEAQAHFDSVAVGECDEIWPGILADAAAGKLQPRYQGSFPDIARSGIGRAKQIAPLNGRYDVGCLQTSRGCPCGCDYCGVTMFNGAEIRRRPIDDIVEEWNSTDKKFLFVVDDNFFGVGPKHAEWAKQLLRELIRRGRKRLWFSQTTVNMGSDPEGLALAYKAGCRGMLVGLETFNPQSLKKYHKGLNTRLLDSYRQLIDGFHRAGIAVFGGFIIGADEDGPRTAAETVLQAVQIGVDIVQVTNLTPLPGTKMYDRLMSEGRIFAKSYPSDWERYSFVETVYTPKGMTSAELDHAIYEIRRAAANPAWVWKRTLKTLWRTRSLTTAAFVHGMNTGWMRMAKIQAPRDAERFGVDGVDPDRGRLIERAFALRSGASLS